MTDDLDELERRVKAGLRLVEQHGGTDKATSLLSCGEVLALITEVRRLRGLCVECLEAFERKHGAGPLADEPREVKKTWLAT